MSTEEKKSTENKLSEQELEEAILKQIDFYFSVENLSKDTFLVSKMDQLTSDVPLSLVASFKLVKQLTEDLELIKKVVKNSKNAVLSDDGLKIRPNIEQTRRTTLILRDLNVNVVKKQIEELFLKVFKEDNKPLDLVKDIGNTWFCKFQTEEHTLEAFKILRNEQLGGSYFGVRIKTENPLINLLAKNNVKYQQQEQQEQQQQQVTQPPPSSQQQSSSSSQKKYNNNNNNNNSRGGNYQRGGKKFSKFSQPHSQTGSNTQKKKKEGGGSVIPSFPKVKELKSGYSEGVKVTKYKKRDFIEVFDKLFESLEGKKEEDSVILKKPKELEGFDCVAEKVNNSLELTKKVYVKPTIVQPKPKKKTAIYVEGGENLVFINEKNVILERPTTPGKKSFAEAAITAKDIKLPKFVEKNVGDDEKLVKPVPEKKKVVDGKKRVKYEKKENDEVQQQQQEVVIQKNNEKKKKKKNKKKIEKFEKTETSVKKEVLNVENKENIEKSNENKPSVEKNNQKKRGGAKKNNKKKKKNEKGLHKIYTKVETKNEKVEEKSVNEKEVALNNSQKNTQSGKTYASIVQQKKIEEAEKTPVTPQSENVIPSTKTSEKKK